MRVSALIPGNVEKPLLSLYGNELRERGFGLCLGKFIHRDGIYARKWTLPLCVLCGIYEGIYPWKPVLRKEYVYVR
jgi:hypothetical protein